MRLKQTSRAKGLKYIGHAMVPGGVCRSWTRWGGESAGAWTGQTDPAEGLRPEHTAVAWLLVKDRKSLVSLREKHPAPPRPTAPPPHQPSTAASHLWGPAPALGPEVLLRVRAPALGGTSVVKHFEYLLILIPGTSE